VSKESWYADAMATAFMVMGLEKSLQFIEQHPEDPDIQAVFFIYNEQGQYKTYATPKFQEIIKEI
jgi:thiamine biosynthesis lipoprotein